MSKINAIRFINVNYNNNTIRINDECMYFQGESTLISLENGGGKSVMIQMLMAPFVQKSYRDMLDRKFSSYFQTAQPSFILVEWALDANAGFVLTGMMVRRNQHSDDENENELEIITLLSEYKEQCLYDIYHLPVVEKEDDRSVLKSFRECKELFAQYKKERSQRFFYFDMNVSSQSSSYFAKLKEYGINYREWQSIIRAVNKEEGGLSKIFAECKDERKLVEKWFLPQIETKLNKESAIITDLQKNIEHYITHLHETESSIAQKDAIVRFTQDASAILDKADALTEALLAKNDAAAHVQAAVSACRELLPRLEEAREMQEKALEEVFGELQTIRYEQLSSAYYQEEDRCKAAQEALLAGKNHLEGIEARIHEQTKIKTIHACQVLQKTRDQQRARYTGLLKEQEIAQSEAKNYNDELARLGGQAKTALSREITQTEALLTSLSDHLLDLKNAQEENRIAREKAEETIRAFLLKKGEIRQICSAYERREDEYFASYDVHFENTFFQTQYSFPIEVFTEHENALLSEKNSLEEDSQACELAQHEAQKRVKTYERQIEEEQNALRDLAIERRIREEEHDGYVAEIEQRKSMISYLDLSEDVLFDTDCLLERCHLTLTERENHIAQLLEKKNDLEQSRLVLQKGFLTLPKRVEAFFADLDIPVTFGLEWLRLHDDSLSAKRALVQKNAFLPYALLVERADLAKIADAPNKVETTSPIPLIPRDSLILDPHALEEEVPDNEKQHVQGSSDASDKTFLLPHSSLDESSQNCFFYTHFESDILDEERLKERLLAIDHERERVDREIETRKNELSYYQGFLLRLKEQKVTEKAFAACKKALDQLMQKEEQKKDAIVRMKDSIAALQKEEEEREEEQKKRTARILLVTEQHRAFVKLKEAYIVYTAQKKTAEQLEASLSKVKEEQNALRTKREELLHDEQLTIGKKRDLSLRLSDLRQKLETVFAPFAAASDLPADFDAILVLAEFETIKRTVESETQINLSHIETELARCKESLDSCEKQLVSFLDSQSITDDSWTSLLITETDVENAKEELKRLQEEQRKANEAFFELTGQARVSENLLKQALQEIKKQCSKEEPLPRQSLRETSFSYLLEQVRCKKETLEKESAEQNSRIEQLKGLLDSYGEYGADRPIETISLPSCFDFESLHI
ncbi:MAG: hypothetical protein J5803_03460 [Desulfovibrio sp.]|nr:hypothetical protein [Desulfovibrio sp.]